MPEFDINVIDTETTGLGGSDQIVEIAVTKAKVLYDDFGDLLDYKIGQTVSSLAKPSVGINLEAMAVHHLRTEMLADAEPADEVLAKFATLKCDYWVAHNAAFDQRFCKPMNGDWICTMKVARVVYPQAPGYKNQVLRYWLGLDSILDPTRIEPIHRAGPDSYITAMLLGKMLATKKLSIQDMFNATCNAPDLVPFGKHKNTPWNKVPQDYLRWIINNQTMSQDVKEKAKKHLKYLKPTF